MTGNVVRHDMAHSRRSTYHDWIAHCGWGKTCKAQGAGWAASQGKTTGSRFSDQGLVSNMKHDGYSKPISGFACSGAGDHTCTQVCKCAYNPISRAKVLLVVGLVWGFCLVGWSFSYWVILYSIGWPQTFYPSASASRPVPKMINIMSICHNEKVEIKKRMIKLTSR